MVSFSKNAILYRCYLGFSISLHYVAAHEERHLTGLE